MTLQDREAAFNEAMRSERGSNVDFLSSKRFHWIETYSNRFWVTNSSKFEFAIGFKTYTEAVDYMAKLHSEHKRII